MKHTIIWDEVAIHSALDEIASLKTQLARSEERRKNLLAALQYIARPDKDAMQRVWMAREALAKDAEEDKE